MPIVGDFCHFVVLYAYCRIVVSVRGSECLQSELFVTSWFCMPIVVSLCQFVILNSYGRFVMLIRRRIVVSIRGSVCL